MASCVRAGSDAMMSGYEMSVSPVKHGLRGWTGVGIRATGNSRRGNGEYNRERQILYISQKEQHATDETHSKAARVMLGSSN